MQFMVETEIHKKWYLNLHRTSQASARCFMPNLLVLRTLSPWDNIVI